MDELTTLAVSSGLVSALLEATKKSLGTHFDWNRFGAWLALAVGVITTVGGTQLGWYPVDIPLGQAVFSGLMAGITASGLNRAITNNAPTVVVQGDIAAQPATATKPATPAATVAAVLPDPAVTDDAGDAAVSKAMEGVARPAAIPPSALPPGPKGV